MATIFKQAAFKQTLKIIWGNLIYPNFLIPFTTKLKQLSLKHIYKNIAGSKDYPTFRYPVVSNLKQISLSGKVVYYFPNYTTSLKKQNAAKDGFNDWGYNLKMNPLGKYELQVITNQTKDSELNYNGVVSLINDNAYVTGSIDGDGVITDLKSEI